MNPTIPQNAVYGVFTVPWKFNDGTYGFKDMPCWVIETPRTDYAEYTEKGIKRMTKGTPACCCCGTSLKHRRAYTLEHQQKSEDGVYNLTMYYCLQCYVRAKNEKEGE